MLLEQKESNIYSNLSIPLINEPIDLFENINKINKVIEIHNKEKDTLSAKQKEAKEHLKFNYIANIIKSTTLLKYGRIIIRNKRLLMN